MKRLLLAAVAALLIAAPVAAFEVPTDLTATMWIVSSTSTTVTIHAEQTSGAPVKLTLTNYCFVNDDVYAGREVSTFTGSADLTFDIGPRKFQGKNLVPTDCAASLDYYMPSQTLLPLDSLDTLVSATG